MPDQPDKSAVRAQVLGARRDCPAAAHAAADAQLVRHAVDLVRGALTITAYVPLPGEPGGPTLPSALAEVVDELLLPVVRPDRDLDWARYDGSLAPGEVVAVAEPTGRRLGRSAIARADLVLVPALSVSPAGVRLGRGGGSYDRALGRVSRGTPVIALLYEGEMRASLPATSHDRPVTAVLTPSGLIAVAPPMV
jgi:5-formyltetrahydrofolate cyclo-ligase